MKNAYTSPETTLPDETTPAAEAADAPGMPEEERQAVRPPDEAALRESYSRLPAWKRGILLAVVLGGMTAVIMLINFVVDFGAELIRTLLAAHG